MCYKPKKFLGELPVYSSPESGMSSFVNTLFFHFNWPLPFFIKTIREVNPDILHSHFGYDAHKMIGPAKRTNVPLVTSFYGSDVTRLPFQFDWKRRYMNLAKHGSHFIAASEIMKKQLIELGFPEEKISIVPFGLDLSVFDFIEDYNLNNNCMMVGRMVEKKGFEFAIRAIAKLKNQNLELKLNLFGDGPLRESLEILTRDLNVENQVSFHGFVDINRINKEMANHGVLLAPSVVGVDGDQEGLPNTILEAMARGIPVIASRHAAIPEAIQNKVTGFLTDEKSPDQIAEVLKQIYDHKFDLDEIRTSARNYILEKHSVEKMVNSVESIYDQVLTS